MSIDMGLSIVQWFNSKEEKNIKFRISGQNNCTKTIWFTQYPNSRQITANVFICNYASYKKRGGVSKIMRISKITQYLCKPHLVNCS